MIIYLETDIFTSPAQTLVNTVNTVGVMGKGIAKTFKKKFPEMFKEYKQVCDNGALDIGSLFLWRGQSKWVLNFPTKTTWRQPARLEYIEKGLQKFANTYESLGIESIAFPPLGCGNGQLDWKVVKPLMEKYLSKLPIRIYIHDIQVKESFVPEHEESNYVIPTSFDAFFNDIRDLVYKQKGTFETLTGSSTYEVLLSDHDCDIKIIRQTGSSQYIPKEVLSSSWSILQSSILSVDQFGEKSSRRYKSYLFPIISALPYVKTTKMSTSLDEHPKYALLFNGESPEKTGIKQGELWHSH